MYSRLKHFYFYGECFMDLAILEPQFGTFAKELLNNEIIFSFINTDVPLF